MANNTTTNKQLENTPEHLFKATRNNKTFYWEFSVKSLCIHSKPFSILSDRSSTFDPESKKPEKVWFDIIEGDDINGKNHWEDKNI